MRYVPDQVTLHHATVVEQKKVSYERDDLPDTDTPRTSRSGDLHVEFPDSDPPALVERESDPVNNWIWRHNPPEIP